MIKFNNVTYTVNNHQIIHNVTFTIPSSGLYFFIGPSGSGKTTLLHLLCGLIVPTEGVIEVFGVNLSQERDEGKHLTNNISIAFQHPIFFDDLTLAENINIIIKSNRKNLNEVAPIIKTKLSKLALENFSCRQVRTMSGGEKARANVVRTLAKEAAIYLFDEPTAALDEHNSQKVFDLLAHESLHKIIIVVTHDYTLAQKYAATFLEVDYGEIVNVTKNSERQTSLYRLAKDRNYKSNVVPLARTLFKRRQRKNALALFAITLGLLSLGLGSLIVTSVNYKLNVALKGTISEETTFIEKTKSPTLSTFKSGTKRDAAYLENFFVTPYAASYYNDLYNFFPSDNKLYILQETRNYPLPSFDINHFNEPLFLFEIREEIFPYIDTLRDDEIILSLPLEDYRLLISVLGLPYMNNAKTLGTYLANNSVFLLLKVSNNNWDYADEQLFLLKGVFLSSEARVIVGSTTFTERLFEERMLLPSSTNLSKEEEYPWVLKKRYFMVTARKEEILYASEQLPMYLFVTAKPIDFKTAPPLAKLYNRIFVYLENPHFNDVFRLQPYQKADNYFYTATNGFTFFAQNLLLGFSHNFLVTADETLLTSLINEDIINDKSANTNFVNDQLFNMNLMFNGFNAFTYKRAKKELALDELSISRGLAKKLGIKQVGETLYVGALTNLALINDYYVKTYETAVIKIADIINDEAFIISHHPLWPYLFLKDELNVNPFSLQLTGLFYEGNFGKIDDLAYRESKPYALYSENIKKSLADIELYTNIIAFTALFTATLIVITMIYLLYEETKEQFLTLRLFGYREKNLVHIMQNYIFYFIRAPTLLALGQTFMLSFALEFMLSKYFVIPFAYIFNAKPYVIIMLFSMVLLMLLSFLSFKSEKIANILAISKKDL